MESAHARSRHRLCVANADRHRQDGALHDTDAYALCSLGHPVAASGARMLVTLVHELRRR
jgi:hypothetical protein